MLLQTTNKIQPPTDIVDTNVFDAVYTRFADLPRFATEEHHTHTRTYFIHITHSEYASLYF